MIFRKPHKRLIIIISLVVLTTSARADDLFFLPELISNDPQMLADLSSLTRSGSQLPGEYEVNVYINGEFKFLKSVNFYVVSDENSGIKKHLPNHVEEITSYEEKSDNTGLVAKFTCSEISDLNVNVRKFPALMALNDKDRVALDLYIPQAYALFDFQKMALNISIPQSAMVNKANGYIEPERWDEGINAALLDYNFSGSNNQGKEDDTKNHYLNLKSGFNVGAWRLRDIRSWTDYRSRYGHSQKWQRMETYAERTVIGWRSSLLLGESSTNGDIFDSVSFKGVKLSTDDNMYPDTMRGFAPIIRGNAGTNAQVSIRQNGYVIYQTYVAPGAFEINDLFPMHSSGDIEVTVKEADGAEKIFTVPYSSLPVLQREGHLKYSLTAGSLRHSSDSYDSQSFTESSLIWGLPHNLTIYGGLQYSKRYLGASIGSGMNMGVLGALSADISQATSKLADGSQHQGQSLRFLYAHSLNSLGTTFQLSGYRYSTKGFHTLEETAMKEMRGWQYDYDQLEDNVGLTKPVRTDYYDLYKTKRAKVEASISQRVGTNASIYLSGIRQTYWGSDDVSNSLQSGFSSTLGQANYSISYNYSRQNNQLGSDESVYLSMSLPLSALLSPSSKRSSRAIYSTFNTSHDNNGKSTQQAGMSGSALKGSNLNWSISQGHSNRNGTNGSASLNYQGGLGNSNLGYSRSNGHHQVSYGMSGGLIIHGDGVTIGQPLADTNVLISAPGARNVSLENGNGVQTDWRGYAIKPYAAAYRENRIALDTNSLDDKTDIEGTVQNVIPTKGAVVKAHFVTLHGMRVLMTLMHKGKPVPMGSIVTAGERGGMVGDDGQVFMSGMSKSGLLTVQWGSAENQRCSVQYQLPDASDNAVITRTKEVCR